MKIRKEKIIEILKEYLPPDGVTISLVNPKSFYNAVAGAILALPIDVPSEEEIKSYVQSQCRYGYSSQEAISIVCVKWAINETLKRNGKVL